MEKVVKVLLFFTNFLFFFQDALSPTSSLIECPKPACAKKFRDLNALKYHLSYAHNDLKKAAAIAAEKRKKILAKSIKTANNNLKKEQTNSTSSSPMKKEIKTEIPTTPKSNGSVEVKPEVKLEEKPVPLVASANPQVVPEAKANNNDHPLDLQKRPVSPAYSDISDEEPPTPASKPIQSTQPLPPSVQHLPSLNNLSHRAQNLSTKPLGGGGGSSSHQPPPQPPPAHTNSVKKPGSLSLEETLKRPPQFGPPTMGFPPGLPSLLGGAGLPAHLAAAVASGRYPPGFMPVTPGFMPGLGAPPSTSTSTGSLSRPYVPPPHSSTASINSASAKLQELQDRVMASSGAPNRSMHLGLPPSSSGSAASLLSSAVSNPSAAAAAINSYSSLARDLLPPAHFNSLQRMASLNPGTIHHHSIHIEEFSSN